MIEIPEFHESLYPEEFLDLVFTTEKEDLEKQFIISVSYKESSKIDCDSIFWDSEDSGTTSSLLIFYDPMYDDEVIFIDTLIDDDDGVIFDKPIYDDLVFD